MSDVQMSIEQIDVTEWFILEKILNHNGPASWRLAKWPPAARRAGGAAAAAAARRKTTHKSHFSYPFIAHCLKFSNNFLIYSLLCRASRGRRDRLMLIELVARAGRTARRSAH